MVRVSWGGEVVIADLSLPSVSAGNRAPQFSGNESPQSPPIPLSPTPPPTSSNTPNTATSPSSYSPPSAASPLTSSAVVSEAFPDGSSTSSRSNSKVEDSLLEELKGELLFLRGNSQAESPSSEMLVLKGLRLKREDEDEDDNNNSTSANPDEEDEDLGSASSVESILAAVDEESLDCRRQLVKKSKPASKLSATASKAEENILSRMLATLSDCEDIDTIDGAESDSEDERMEQEKELLIDKWRQLFDKFDFEGFGEIPWPEFQQVLVHPEFMAEVDVHKREQLGAQAASAKTSAITFQNFVNVVSFYFYISFVFK